MRHKRFQAAAQATTGEVRTRADNQHRQIADAPLPQAERARQNNVSTRTQGKLDVLARKAPEQLERVKAGLVSVRRAYIEAGLEKEPTALEQLKRWWARATASQRRAFLAWQDKEKRGA